MTQPALARAVRRAVVVLALLKERPAMREQAERLPEVLLRAATDATRLDLRPREGEVVLDLGVLLRAIGRDAGRAARRLERPDPWLRDVRALLEALSALARTPVRRAQLALPLGG